VLGTQPNKDIKMIDPQHYLSRTLGAAFFACLLSGCVATPPQLYHWGPYQDELYARFKTKSSPEQQILEMEKSLSSAGNKTAAPGYHAHLGLLYGEVGRIDDMRTQLTLEKQLFPESAQFMDFLLSKAEKSKGTKK
jgi:hypothetical protein